MRARCRVSRSASPMCLVVMSIAMLVLYVDHIGRSLRVSSLIELVGDDTRCLLDVQYPDTLSVDDVAPSVILASESGVVTAIDRDALVEAAVSADCVLHVVPAVGSFVPAGAPLIDIEGPWITWIGTSPSSCITLGLERTLDEDVAYGFRMLVDVAERSLSESPFLDPTTAVQSIDRLHDALAPAGRSSDPRRPTLRRCRQSSSDSPVDGLGCVRPSRVRRDPPRRCRVATGQSTTVRGLDRPDRLRPAGPPTGPRRTARTPAGSNLHNSGATDATSTARRPRTHKDWARRTVTR